MTPPLLQVQQVRDKIFMHKWGNGERLLLATCVGLSFPRYLRPNNNDQQRDKRNVPHLLQAQQAPVCLWSISETLQCRKLKGQKKRPEPTASTAGTCLSVVNFGNAPVPCRNCACFRHWSVSEIDHTQTGACCACSRCGTFLLSLYWSLLFGRKYRGKDSPTHAASNSRSPFPHLCTKKLSRTCCTCSRGGVTISPSPRTTSPFKSPYHGKAENDIS